MSYLKIRNKKSGREFETTREEYDRLIANEGQSHKYEILDDGTPFEIKRMKAEKQKKEEQKPVTETEEKSTKADKKGKLTEIKKE